MPLPMLVLAPVALLPFDDDVCCVPVVVVVVVALVVVVGSPTDAGAFISC